MKNRFLTGAALLGREAGAMMDPGRALRMLIADIERSIADAEAYNAEAVVPVDIEPERVLAAMARRCLAAWGRNDILACRRECGAMAKYARQVRLEERIERLVW